MDTKLIAVVFVVALVVLLISGAPPFADLFPPMDPTKLIAVVLVFAVTFGVLLIFGAPPIAALFVGGFAGLVAAARTAKGR